MQATGERVAPTRELRVVLADDDADFLLILRARLNLLPGIAVVATATDGAEAIAEVERTSPDVVVVDLLMPIVDGYAVLEQLRTRAPGTAAVAYSGVATESARERVGALGVELVLKTRDTTGLADAIRRCATTGPPSART